MAACCFSVMGGAAKLLQTNFNTGQLVFWRNMVGLMLLMISLLAKPPISRGGKLPWLIFRGLMGTIALYTLLYCVLHLPLGTAMTYNLTSSVFIALFSFILFKEYNGHYVLAALFIGFTGMILVYKPSMHFPWQYHIAGLVSGISSAIAYLTVGKLSKYYDARIIVLSFIAAGIVIPLFGWMLYALFQLPSDEFFITSFKMPLAANITGILVLGLSAVAGQYFVTKAYSSDKAGIVSVFSYSNILFSVFIGTYLGDAFPDMITWWGMIMIILSGVIISFQKKK